MRRDLPEVASGIWAGPISEGEFLLADTEVDGEPVGSVSNGGARMLPGKQFAFVPVAPAGTTPDDLEQAIGALEYHVGPSIDEVPVYAARASAGKGHSASVTLMRAPSGAYLFGLADTRPATGNASGHTEWSEDGTGTTAWTAGGTVPAGPDPEDVSVAMRVRPVGEEDAANTYVVLAPEDAVQVRVGEVVAEVRNRIAVVEVPVGQDPAEPSPAEALDSEGKVISEVTPLKSN